jgi:hypothetical protein
MHKEVPGIGVSRIEIPPQQVAEDTRIKNIKGKVHNYTNEVVWEAWPAVVGDILSPMIEGEQAI